MPDDFQMMADGNAGYTFPRAIEMGAILDRLGFVWFEEPVHQRGGYQGYDRLAAALDIALAGGEILDNREPLRSSCSPAAASTSSSPSRSSAAASPETLWIAELAAVHSIPAMPHTSNNAIGIAAAAPDPGLPARPEPVARLG